MNHFIKRFREFLSHIYQSIRLPFDAEVAEKLLKVSTTYLLQQSKNFKLKTLTADVFIGTKLSA